MYVVLQSVKMKPRHVSDLGRRETKEKEIEASLNPHVLGLCRV